MAQNLATRLFKDRPSAEREYEALVARGFSPKDVQSPRRVVTLLLVAVNKGKRQRMEVRHDAQH